MQADFIRAWKHSYDADLVLKNYYSFSFYLKGDREKERGDIESPIHWRFTLEIAIEGKVGLGQRQGPGSLPESHWVAETQALESLSDAFYA